MRNKILTFAAALLCTACLEETIPTDAVTEEIVDASSNSTEAMMTALSGRFHAEGSSSYGHYAFGYGAMMHIRDVQTGDLCVSESSYDQFTAWECNLGLGANSNYTNYTWNYYYQNIRACNNILDKLSDHAKTDDMEKAAIGAAYGFRALNYIDLARCYEFLPCDVYPEAVNGNGNSIKGLTVPIVTEATTEESAQETPRATREEMAQFILNDLDSAEVYIEYLDKSDFKNDYTMPHIYSIYGLKARLYMWMADDEHPEYYRRAYDNAINAVQKATAAGHIYMYQHIMNGEFTAVAVDAQGYASLISSFAYKGMFMWGATQTSDNATVKTGVVNWTSWMNPFTTYGYAGYLSAGVMSCIDKRLYNRMTTSDWRRLLYAFGVDGLPDGTASKFDVNEQDFDLPLVSAATTYPIMRIEEIYLIACEAAAHLNAAQGLAMLNAFMTTYCDGNYKYEGERTPEAIIEEIVTQKRIELWGEGQAFFDIKRLNIPVTRGYKGTGFASTTRFNTETRPAWMNWVISLNEENTNHAVRDYNNPDPSGRYTPWVE